MIVDCAHYRDGRRQHDGPMELEHAANFCQSDDAGFVWLGLFGPGVAELTEVQDRFGLHDLAIEDVQNMHLRPKFERYSESDSFVVIRTARYLNDTEEVDFGEVGVFIGERFVIAVPSRSCQRPARCARPARGQTRAPCPGAAECAVGDYGQGRR